ncbi:iron complex transport system ATP-binding protein [Glaciihabitans tibetensis]|uniref:Iron complex transport system ATP-binding protein n=1 Tax=Glaciihabitans tibetensis TaxID=1266600 RepID=A0A2T0VI62_9MICO|nr:heme ABC transporter ATP-binding protein [Glaciihabitans tibetensis]PRY69898.1 iron complex transport system ATP-binding protein [Glaciihabitans tibetensis]
MTLGLEASGLTMQIDGTTLLDSVALAVPSGSVTALIGPNGAGKSTLIRVLAGVTRPTAGTVAWNGVDLAAVPRRDRARTAALVEQDARAELPMTVESVVGLGRVPYRAMFAAESADELSVVRAALAEVGITSFARRQFDSLSGGERQRVHLARALAQQPKLLLLDEPTNHLDVHAQLDTLELVRRLATRDGVTVLAALHDLNLAAAYADDIVVLAAGCVVASGTPDQVLTPELLREVYRVEATVLEHPVTGRPLIAYSPAAGGAARDDGR